MKRKLLCLLAGLALMTAGCSRQKETGRFLAKVGRTSLYMNEVAAHVDTNSAYAVRNYVSHWVNQQLLYDEASREGLDNTPEFNDRVEEFSRQLAITMILNRKVYDPPVIFTAGEIADFYQSHRDEFKASENVALANIAGFDKRSFAVSFRNSLVSGGKWGTEIRNLPPYAILDERDSVYVLASGVNPAIWNVIQSLESGRTSFPIQVDTLSYVVQVIRKFVPGDPLPLDYAARSIGERLTVIKRRQLYQNFLDSLRSVGDFQVDPSVAIKDTSAEE